MNYIEQYYNVIEMGRVTVSVKVWRLYELESKGIMEAGPGVYHGQGATSKGWI